MLTRCNELQFVVVLLQSSREPSNKHVQVVSLLLHSRSWTGPLRLTHPDRRADHEDDCYLHIANAQHSKKQKCLYSLMFHKNMCSVAYS